MPVGVAPMTAEQTAIPGLWQIATKTITDERGTVREFFRTSGFADLGVPAPAKWTQINLTWSCRGALRGMHGEPITKLVGIASGSAFGAYVDARKASPTYGTVLTLPLVVGVQMLVPPGVCNGFQTLSDGGSEYLYCFDGEWTPSLAGVAVNPLDPALGIAWPIPVDATDPAAISAKDATAPLFAELGG
jgi:dTDP-4-dehydrorhamnose 3,5-epimerase